MKEVEILIEVKSKKEDVLNVLSKFNFSGEKKVLDMYFYDEKRDALKPKEGRLTECFRLRKKDGVNFITYKNDKFAEGGKWLYSEEEETEVKDFDAAIKIVSNLGLVPLLEIENVKYVYYTDKYEIVLEEVKNLGLFLEVERLNVSEEEDIIEIKKDIFDFINSLGIEFGDELNSGKPELMLSKKS